ncbi:uncharacterized protein LOC132580014 [Heteronotia binoei]|uniref:uncharacterized protein LOC132580014 n=1 Tax=Heteronotia binoei TaxID=13085 RepID=UPI00292F7AA3|nr:uncharacterized protein LOC132580014 [Heteronotia binoei]
MEYILAKSRILWRHNWISAFAALLLLLRGRAQPCPPMCQFCSTDRAECEEVASLQTVLIGLPNITEKIVLRHGNLSEIPPQSFQKFPNLHFLSITGFPVSSLTALTFSPDHANSLWSLDLSNNHLLSCSIHPMVFSRLVTLQELALNNNSLDILQSPWFLGLMALSKLSLALNRISYLPPRMFENLARLEELVISSNEIQYLSMDTFYGLASLAQLDLSNNKILFINNDAFQPLKALRHLLLSNNRLTALPVLPNSITSLLLHSNPWDCSCQLVVSVESWVNTIQEAALVVCSTPPRLAGCQVIRARLEVCSSSSSDSNLPPSTIWNLSFLYGFLGGLFIGLMLFLIFCCCLKLCKCPSMRGQAEGKKSFLHEPTGVFLGKATATRADPQILGSFPVIGNTMIGFEVGNLARGPCDHLHETFRTCNMEQMRPTAERPLVALLSVDRVTNKTVVTLCEKGNETAGSRGEWIHSPSQLPGFLGDAGQQCFAHGEHKSCGSSFQHTTSNQTERIGSVFPVVGWGVDPRSDERTSKSDAVQPPRASIHEDFPAGNVMKMQRAVGRATSSQRDEPSRSGCHINASHSWSEMEGKTSSPARSYPPGFPSPSYVETSEKRHWQEEGFTERRNLKSRAKSGESFWKAGLDSQAYRLRLSRSSRKLLGNLRQVPSYEATPTSSLSSSSSSYSVALQPRKRTRFSLHLCAAPRRRKTSLVHKKPRRQQTDLNVAMARDASTVEKLWECPICGCEESHQCLIAQRRLDRQADAVPSKGLLDVASQRRSSFTAPLKDHETAQPSLVPHQNTENLLAGDLLEPHPHRSLGISLGGPSEEEEEPTDEYPQLLCAKSTPRTELSQQAPDGDFPVAEKTVTQVILREEGGVGMVHTITEVGSMTVHSIKNGKVRSLGEEMYNAQEQVQAIARAFDQCLADQEKAQVDTSSGMLQLSPCLVDRSSSEMSFGGREERSLWEANNRGHSEMSFSEDEEPKLWEATNVTSSYPLVQRMFQIDFPLSNEE